MKLCGSFEEKGYKIEAYIPTRDIEPQEFLVRAYKEEKLIKEIKIPMMHEPRFGVDVEDKRRLEDKTEELLEELP